MNENLSAMQALRLRFDTGGAGLVDHFMSNGRRRRRMVEAAEKRRLRAAKRRGA